MPNHLSCRCNFCGVKLKASKKMLNKAANCPNCKQTTVISPKQISVELAPKAKSLAFFCQYCAFPQAVNPEMKEQYLRCHACNKLLFIPFQVETQPEERSRQSKPHHPARKKIFFQCHYNGCDAKYQANAEMADKCFRCFKCNKAYWVPEQSSLPNDSTVDFVLEKVYDSMKSMYEQTKHGLPRESQIDWDKVWPIVFLVVIGIVLAAIVWTPTSYGPIYAIAFALGFTKALWEYGKQKYWW